LAKNRDFSQESCSGHNVFGRRGGCIRFSLRFRNLVHYAGLASRWPSGTTIFNPTSNRTPAMRAWQSHASMIFY